VNSCESLKHDDSASALQALEPAELAGVEGGFIDCFPWLTKLVPPWLRWPKADLSI
jgi:hypothetical protein